MRRYKSTKLYLWSEEIAYLAGLFASDGCLLSDGRHLNITSKDLEIIQYCQSILGAKSKISVKLGQFNTPAYCWQFSDVALYDFLLNEGITPRKSLTINRVNVPDIYWGDFLRGYFDGDGTTYGYTEKRWKGSKMYYIGFISASLDFLVWLSSQNKRLAGTNGESIRKGNRAKALTYAKQDSVKLFAIMYSSKTAAEYSLSRKRSKLNEFILTDSYDKI